MQNAIYIQTGINWEFCYEVLYEDLDILVVKDLGRFHRFDENQKWKGARDKYIDFAGDFVLVGSRKKLVEIQRP